MAAVDVGDCGPAAKFSDHAVEQRESFADKVMAITGAENFSVPQNMQGE